MKFIVLIVIVLGIIAIAQMMRVYELTSKLRNRREEDIQLRDNKLNATLMLIFMIVLFGSYIFMLFRYGRGGLPEAASAEGVNYDWLMDLNMIIISAVFFLTNFLLFFFCFKYYKKPGVDAYFYPHNNKLELVWTVIPSMVLAVIIILGLKDWNSRTAAAAPESVRVEIYGKQFDWTVRYAGLDNQLGEFDYKLVNGTNPLGLVTAETIKTRIYEMDSIVSMLEANLNDPKLVYSKETLDKMEDELATKERIYQRLIQMQQTHDVRKDVHANDDVVEPSNTELVLCKGKEYEFNLRSQDVIHSAYFPHFRAQMNTVPGMVTRLKFTPTLTTKEMREKLNNPDFNYVLMCNKVCGASHSNMMLKIKVVEPAFYNTWWPMKAASGAFKK
ncbi:MAG: cytochrome c oxidase subunit II transmembrane domain-containing protein [Crocinitomicaceae bacterium]